MAVTDSKWPLGQNPTHFHCLSCGPGFYQTFDEVVNMFLWASMAAGSQLCSIKSTQRAVVLLIMRARGSSSAHRGAITSDHRRTCEQFTQIRRWNRAETCVRTDSQHVQWNNGFRHLIGHAHPSLWVVTESLEMDKAVMAIYPSFNTHLPARPGGWTHPLLHCTSTFEVVMFGQDGPKNKLLSSVNNFSCILEKLMTQLRMYCHLRPSDAMPLPTLISWGLGAPATSFRSFHLHSLCGATLHGWRRNHSERLQMVLMHCTWRWIYWVQFLYLSACLSFVYLPLFDVKHVSNELNWYDLIWFHSIW